MEKQIINKRGSMKLRKKRLGSRLESSSKRQALSDKTMPSNEARRGDKESVDSEERPGSRPENGFESKALSDKARPSNKARGSDKEGVDSRALSDKARASNKARGGGDRGGVDRFSMLMDDAIVNILSFLPAEDVLRTCVLSKQWLKHWMLVKNLDFDYQSPVSISCHNNILLGFRHSYEDGIKFMTCVTRAIRLTNNSPVRRFSLNFDHPNNIHLSDWIMKALHSVLLRGIRELDLHVSRSLQNILPWNLLLCTTLEVLKLGTRFLLEVPYSFCLPKLKILSLKYMRFSDDQSANRLISSCPMLEDLSICGEYNRTNVLHVTAPALKTFCTVGYAPRTIVLDTPRLESLIVARNFAIQLKHPHTLVRAELGLVPAGGDKLLSQVGSVHSIRFLDIPEEWQSSIIWPDFQNLKYSCIGCPSSTKWSKLMLLLDKAPRLETLVFEKGLADIFLRFTTFETPPCLLQLKVIVIGNFGGEDWEMKVLEYLLSTCKALKKMEIYTESEVVKMDLMDKLKTTKSSPEVVKIDLMDKFKTTSSRCEIL